MFSSTVWLECQGKTLLNSGNGNGNNQPYILYNVNKFFVFRSASFVLAYLVSNYNLTLQQVIILLHQNWINWPFLFMTPILSFYFSATSQNLISLLFSGPLPPKDSPSMGEPQQGVSLTTRFMGAATFENTQRRKQMIVRPWVDPNQGFFTQPQHFYQFTLTYWLLT